MMEQVLAPENLQRAWRRVKSNAGAPGIDGITVKAFPASSRKHWPRIRSALMTGTYYWKQWKRPRPRRRRLLALGIPREQVHMATRSRKGYWRMSANSIVQRALTNCWLHEQGIPNMRESWIVLHYGDKARI